MSAFLASVISIAIINALGLFGTIWGLRIRDKVDLTKFIVTTAIVTLAFLAYSTISVRVIQLSPVLDIILSIVVFLGITYIAAKVYLKFDEALSRKFAIYYTILGTILGIVIGILLSALLLGLFSRTFFG